MTGLALMALLLTTPAQVEVRSQHQLVSVDGKTWRWVRPGVPLSLDVKRQGKQRLAVELIRLGTPGTESKSERVDVRLGKQRKPVRLKLQLQGSRAVPGQGSLRMSYSVRHRFRLPPGKTNVKISASAKQSPFGVLVRASLSQPKAVPDEGGLALAPLGALPPADKADKPAKRKRRRGKRRRSRRADSADKTADKTADKNVGSKRASRGEPAKTGRPSKEEGKLATPPGPAAASADSPAATSTESRPGPDDGKPATPRQPPSPEAPVEPVTKPGPPTGAEANTADSNGADSNRADPNRADPNKASAADAQPAGEGAVDAPPPPPAAAEPAPPPAQGREGREDREREGTESSQPTVEHRPERPAEQPLPPDAPTESVEVIELVPQEPRALLGPRQLGTGVPLLVEAQVSPGLIVQPLGGLSNVATSGGLRLLFGVNLGFFSRFTYGAGVDIDYQAAATTPGSPAASVRWQTGQMRLRLEGAFDVLRLDISDYGRLHVGVLGGVGAILGAHWLSQGTDVVTHPMIGPTARVGLTGGFTVGPGSLTLSLPIDWSYGVGAVAGYAPLAGTFFLGYRLEL